MNRDDFQRLARLRLREARILRDGGFPAGAYYLAGLAVECALKACLARATQKYDFPDKKTVNESHTHDLTTLLRLANLETVLQADAKTRPAIALNWTTVRDWRIEARYNRSTSVQQAADLYRAASQKQTGWSHGSDNIGK